jgi:lysyl-tRNA synthetase, class II
MTLPERILEDNDQTRARREHLEAIRALVGNAYPNRFARTNVCRSAEGEDTVSAVVSKFKHLEPRAAEGAKPSPEQLEAANAELGGAQVRVAGRLATPPRVMGKVAFVHLSDGRERLQIYVRKDEARAVSNDTDEVIDEPESGWRLFQLLDHGDFAGVSGFLFVTKTGELSVHVREIQFLAKSLVPMPDKMHGIADPEIGRRRRYADLIASSLKIEREPGELTTREVFERRSRLITELRRHLDARGYVEVETPMLSPVASGAAARPFKTHHSALGIDLYARIAPELYLKRLLVGGFERVYELNRNFRNEGLGYRWNPEFTMLEFYCAYMDADGMMDFCEQMLRTNIKTATGKLRFQFGHEEIDFERPFERLTMKDAIAKYWPAGGPAAELSFQNMSRGKFDRSWLDDSDYIFYLAAFLSQWPRPSAFAFLPDYSLGNLAEMQDRLVNMSSMFPDLAEQITAKTAEEFRQKFLERFVEEIRKSNPEDTVQAFRDENPDDSEEARAAWVVYVFEKVYEIFRHWIRSQISFPTFIMDFPKSVSPLSKASPADPSVAERFELYVAGMEIANGFSELNDPVEQYARFEEQARQRERGDDEAMQTDEDYVRALSYGMPPAAGIGIGIDRLTMLLTNRKSIRDVILFPHMRPAAPKQDADEQAEAVEELSEALDELGDDNERP